MRKITLALGSFVLGALSMSLLGSHTSTVAQERPSTGGSGLSQGFAAQGAEPVVPPLMFEMRGGAMSAEQQQLDGINCVGCVLEADIITYAGGQFRCENCRVSAKQGVALKGAALNTLNALRFFGAIPGPKPGVPPPQRKPGIVTAALSKAQTVNWVSLEK